ncbi:hypothetical protein HDV00_004355, partial [Rhizophlyctis rosea]
PHRSPPTSNFPAFQPPKQLTPPSHIYPDFAQTASPTPYTAPTIPSHPTYNPPEPAPSAVPVSIPISTVKVSNPTPAPTATTTTKRMVSLPPPPGYKPSTTSTKPVTKPITTLPRTQPSTGSAALAKPGISRPRISMNLSTGLKKITPIKFGLGTSASATTNGPSPLAKSLVKAKVFDDVEESKDATAKKDAADKTAEKDVPSQIPQAAEKPTAAATAQEHEAKSTPSDKTAMVTTIIPFTPFLKPTNGVGFLSPVPRTRAPEVAEDSDVQREFEKRKRRYRVRRASESGSDEERRRNERRDSLSERRGSTSERSRRGSLSERRGSVGGKHERDVEHRRGSVSSRRSSVRDDDGRGDNGRRGSVDEFGRASRPKERKRDEKSVEKHQLKGKDKGKEKLKRTRSHSRSRIRSRTRSRTPARRRREKRSGSRSEEKGDKRKDVDDWSKERDGGRKNKRMEKSKEDDIRLSPSPAKATKKRGRTPEDTRESRSRTRKSASPSSSSRSSRSRSSSWGLTANRRTKTKNPTTTQKIKSQSPPPSPRKSPTPTSPTSTNQSYSPPQSPTLLALTERKKAMERWERAATRSPSADPEVERLRDKIRNRMRDARERRDSSFRTDDDEVSPKRKKKKRRKRRKGLVVDSYCPAEEERRWREENGWGGGWGVGGGSGGHDRWDEIRERERGVERRRGGSGLGGAEEEKEESGSEGREDDAVVVVDGGRVEYEGSSAAGGDGDVEMEGVEGGGREVETREGRQPTPTPPTERTPPPIFPPSPPSPRAASIPDAPESIPDTPRVAAPESTPAPQHPILRTIISTSPLTQPAGITVWDAAQMDGMGVGTVGGGLDWGLLVERCESGTSVGGGSVVKDEDGNEMRDGRVRVKVWTCGVNGCAGVLEGVVDEVDGGWNMILAPATHTTTFYAPLPSNPNVIHDDDLVLDDDLDFDDLIDSFYDPSAVKKEKEEGEDVKPEVKVPKEEKRREVCVVKEVLERVFVAGGCVRGVEVL